MNWLRRLIHNAQNQDAFWAEWHRERRKKRLAYFVEERAKAIDRAVAASQMVNYYRGLLRDDATTPQKETR